MTIYLSTLLVAARILMHLCLVGVYVYLVVCLVYIFRQWIIFLPLIIDALHISPVRTISQKGWLVRYFRMSLGGHQERRRKMSDEKILFDYVFLVGAS